MKNTTNNLSEDCWVYGCRCQPPPEECATFKAAFPCKRLGLLTRIKHRFDTWMIGRMISFAEIRMDELEMDKTQIKNRQRGAPLWRLNPKIQTIKNATSHFGFRKLSSDSRLLPEVLRKLRDLGLLPKTTRIKRL